MEHTVSMKQLCFNNIEKTELEHRKHTDHDTKS